MNTCQCGCGEVISDTATWARGHHRRSLVSVPRQAKGPRPAVAGPVFSAGQYVTPDEPEKWYEQEAADPGPVSSSVNPDSSFTDDIDSFTERDGDPGYLKSPETPPDTPSSITAAQRADIAGKLALMFTIPYSAVALRDPYCAEALAKSTKPMIKACLPIIAGSPGAVEFFTKQSGWLAWLNLAAAARPVLEAFYAHHVVHKVETVQDEQGRRRVVPVDYSAYSAA